MLPVPRLIQVSWLYLISCHFILGCAFLTKNYLPNIKADIITIEAAFRLTDAPDIAPNAKYSIEFRCFANTRLLKSLTATVVAQREQDPLLKIDIHFFNKQIVRR